MCGRFATTRDPDSLAAEFDAVDGTEGLAGGADYNVAPTKHVPAIVTRHPRDAEGEPDPDSVVRSVRMMRWGLVPMWAKDLSVGSRMINARVESAAEKPAFRKAFARRRCLIPADGWYEWQVDGDRKQPFFMTPEDGSVLAIAGVWETWRSPKSSADELPVVTFAVLTRDSFGQLAEVHDRMPVMLPQHAWAAWLDPDSADPSELVAEPDEALYAGLELRPVATKVNSVRNNGPELLDRFVQEEPAEQSLFELP
ncbi:SOS response-associated peptidase [Allokutzneria sp. NRRL B-24872]|uniref:SOS response-associated peptidase n=1 Tax=Allokutzneria sp. NRRL B-24872 TaxID=1137961 RepID=UPI000A3941C0|nr:SOS response-associated peptidase [Allokutzneria sp. NRRL B-24872]